jgi:subtilisin
MHDLADNYKGGYDFVNNDADPKDDNGHGTHVSGTVAAIDNNIGVIGAAPEVNLYALKVLGEDGSGSYSDIISALQWAVDNHMDVASMSLGGLVRLKALEDACDSAYESGVVIVAAAGNEGRRKVSYPAAYNSVIAVTATDDTDTRASFSNYGPQIELAAPGVGINSTLPTYKVTLTETYGLNYGTLRGTSMATPHVTGAVALLLTTSVPTDYDTNTNGQWDPAEVRQRLQDTATDLGAAGKDIYYGYGLVNASAAVEATTPEPEGSEMHIGNITMDTGSKTAGINTFTWALATVTVVNSTGYPVSSAVVSGSWSDLTSDSDTGTTDADGNVTVQSNKVKNPSGTFTFTVTDVELTNWTYNATANVEVSDFITV